MIRSMTGYGGAKNCEGVQEISVELKSVNNRYLDTSVRMPRSLMFAEESVKTAVSACISRGKVDVFVSLGVGAQGEATVVVNEALAAEYKAAIELVGSKLNLEYGITAYDICRFPDVLVPDKKEVDRQQVLTQLMDCVRQAVSEFDAMREKEGEKLCQDISAHLDTLESFVGFVEQRSPQTVAEYRSRLTKRMLEVLENTQLDESRILTEAALYADRIAVDEETVRLRSHIGQMRELLAGSSPVGRKLDFIVQELNRETNTIGSKCNDQEITHQVLDAKSEIEKIREQVQNIE